MKRPLIATNFDILDESGVDITSTSPEAKRRRLSPLHLGELFRVFILLPFHSGTPHVDQRPTLYAYLNESADPALDMDGFLDTLLAHASSGDFRITPASSPTATDGSWPVKLAFDWLTGFNDTKTQPRIIPSGIAKSCREQRGNWITRQSTYGYVTSPLTDGQAASELHLIPYDTGIATHQMKEEREAAIIAAATKEVAHGIKPSSTSIPATLEHLSM
jgi:hypothetical protein